MYSRILLLKPPLVLLKSGLISGAVLILNVVQIRWVFLTRKLLLISSQKMLWVLLRSALLRRFY